MTQSTPETDHGWSARSLLREVVLGFGLFAWVGVSLIVARVHLLTGSLSADWYNLAFIGVFLVALPVVAYVWRLLGLLQAAPVSLPVDADVLSNS